MAFWQSCSIPAQKSTCITACLIPSLLTCCRPHPLAHTTTITFAGGINGTQEENHVAKTDRSEPAERAEVHRTQNSQLPGCLSNERSQTRNPIQRSGGAGTV